MPPARSRPAQSCSLPTRYSANRSANMIPHECALHVFIISWWALLEHCQSRNVGDARVLGQRTGLLNFYRLSSIFNKPFCKLINIKVCIPDLQERTYILPLRQCCHVGLWHMIISQVSKLVRVYKLLTANWYRFDLGEVLYAVNSIKDNKGRQILWGWLQEGDRDDHGYSYSGCQSLPRELLLLWDPAVSFFPFPHENTSFQGARLKETAFYTSQTVVILRRASESDSKTHMRLARFDSVISLTAVQSTATFTFTSFVYSCIF